MSKKKTLPKTLKQYAYYLKEYKEYKEKYLPEEFNQLELLDELCNDEIDHYISIKSRSNGKSFNYYNERKKKSCQKRKHYQKP